MAFKAQPGRPLGPVFDEYPRATREEVAAAAQQAAELGRDRDVRKQLAELYERMISRRGEREEWQRSPTKAHLSYFADDTELPLLTLDELLVRTRDLDGDDDGFRRTPMRRLLARFELDENPVRQLDNRVTRLRREGMGPRRLAAIGALLRRHGYQATMNQCHPLGYVTKSVFGEVGPEPSNRPTLPTYPGDELPDGWSAVAVAVLDTGIVDDRKDTGQARTDGWLSKVTRDRSGKPNGNIDPLYEIAGGPEFDNGAGHGTFVAGVLQQVDPHADISVIRVLGADGIGCDVEVAIGILEALQHGARILNLSLGAETADDQPPLAILVALELIAELRRDGRLDTDVVLVAAAGNNRNTRPVWPAAFCTIPTFGVRVVSVAALAANREPADFSTHGFWITCSTIGNGVLSPFVLGEETPEMDPAPDSWTGENPWAIWTGTSFAAPQVAGAIARRCQTNNETPSEALDWLLAQGVWVPDYGRALEILPAG